MTLKKITAAGLLTASALVLAACGRKRIPSPKPSKSLIGPKVPRSQPRTRHWRLTPLPSKPF